MKKIIPLHKTYSSIEILFQITGMIAVVIGLMVVFQLFGQFSALPIFHISINDLANFQDSTNQNVINAMKYIQFWAVIGLFALPAFVIPKVFFKYQSFSFLNLNRNTQFRLLLFSIVAFICFLPMISNINIWNAGLDFPNGSVENWMKDKESLAMKMTISMLKGTDTTTLIINLLIMALLPAIAEELFFRGLLQRVIFLYSRNIHVTIFVVAILFSAFHLQFYGFFPRFIFGLIFGYVLYWTGDLKIPMALHFINNAFAVLSSHFQQLSGKPLDVNEDLGVPFYFSLFGAVLGSLFLYFIYKNGSLYSKDVSEEYLEVIKENEREYKFISVYTATSQINAEIIIGSLKDNGFEVMSNNTQSSAYPIFGNISIMVPQEQAIEAYDYLKSIEK